MKVLLTVDTEFWPQTGAAVAPADIDRDFYGLTRQGEYGARFQAERLAERGQKAVFHTEMLSAVVTGEAPHRDLIAELQSRRQDVQLHVHPEWLGSGASAVLPDRTGQNMHEFTEDEQTTLLAKGVELLNACGAERVCAFRAGNYGADWNTLKALARNDIRFDTSLNTCYLGRATKMWTESPLLQPKEFENVWEFPVGFIRDYPGHRRHLQLTACSLRELTHALDRAHEAGWEFLVLVSHSFELLDRKALRPDKVVIRRFEGFCDHLARHPDRFQTIGFEDIDATSLAARPDVPPLRSSPWFAMLRYGEQALRRFAR